VGLAGGAPPVVVRIAKAVQRGGDEVVELVQVGPAACFEVEQPGVLAQLGGGVVLEGGEEVAGVDAVEAASRYARRRSDRGGQMAAAASMCGRHRAPGAEPQSRALPPRETPAAKRGALVQAARRARIQRSLRRRRVVGAGQAVWFAGAAAEVGHDAVPVRSSQRIRLRA
jgi:hypothetical protein